MSQVDETNAYKLCDNYRIEREDGTNCVGVEHNQQEAEAIARWLTNYHGSKYVVRKNSLDEVREAKKLRDPNNFRFKYREDVFREMGVWK